MKKPQSLDPRLAAQNQPQSASNPAVPKMDLNTMQLLNLLLQQQQQQQQQLQQQQQPSQQGQYSTGTNRPPYPQQQPPAPGSYPQPPYR